MMKNLFAGVAILFAGVLNAQWDTLNTGTDNKVEAIAFRNGNEGIILCNDGNGYGSALLTLDRGATWNTLFGYALARHDVDFTPVGTIWIVGDSGRVVHKGFPSPSHISEGYISSRDLYCGYPVNDSAFFCGGENGCLFRTWDYGLSWDTLDAGTTETINDIYFTDAANGWIIGDDGVLSVTADSGSTWTTVLQPQWGFTDFYGFAYLDSMGVNPYIVGEAGCAQFSIDGGVTWYYAMTATTEDINMIRFGTPNSGIMVGNGGYILRTENAAFTWTIDASPVSSDLFDVAYASDTMAFICGDNGVVLRSNADVSSVPQQAVSTLAASAYPNPSSGPLNVNLILQEASDVQIQIVDLTGQVVQNNYYQSVSAGQSTIPVVTNDLAQGVYFLKISTESGELTLPIVRD